MNKNKISPRMKRLLEKGRAEAHKRVVARGTVQFKADRELMEQLLVITHHKKAAIGRLVKSWIAPIIRQEYEELVLKFIMLPTGKILTSKSNTKELEQVLNDFDVGQIALSQKQVVAIQNWLISSSIKLQRLQICRHVDHLKLH